MPTILTTVKYLGTSAGDACGQPGLLSRMVAIVTNAQQVTGQVIHLLSNPDLDKRLNIH